LDVDCIKYVEDIILMNKQIQINMDMFLIEINSWIYKDQIRKKYYTNLNENINLEITRINLCYVNGLTLIILLN